MIFGILLSLFVTFLVPFSIYVIHKAQQDTAINYAYIPKIYPKLSQVIPNLEDGDIIECYKKRYEFEDYKEAKYICNMFGLEREPYDSFDALLDNSVFYHQINKEKRC